VVGMDFLQLDQWPNRSRKAGTAGAASRGAAAAPDGFAGTGGVVHGEGPIRKGGATGPAPVAKNAGPCPAAPFPAKGDRPQRADMPTNPDL